MGNFRKMSMSDSPLNAGKFSAGSFAMQCVACFVAKQFKYGMAAPRRIEHHLFH